MTDSTQNVDGNVIDAVPDNSCIPYSTNTQQVNRSVPRRQLPQSDIGRPERAYKTNTQSRQDGHSFHDHTHDNVNYSQYDNICDRYDAPRSERYTGNVEYISVEDNHQQYQRQYNQPRYDMDYRRNRQDNRYENRQDENVRRSQYNRDDIDRIQDEVSRQVTRQDMKQLEDTEDVNVTVRLPKRKSVIISPNTNISKSEYYCIDGDCIDDKYINRVKTKVEQPCTQETLDFYRQLTISKGMNHEISDDKEYSPLYCTRVINDQRINSVVRLFNILRKNRNYNVTDCILGLNTLKRLDVLCQALKCNGKYILILQNYRTNGKRFIFQITDIKTEDIREYNLVKRVHKFMCGQNRCITITVCLRRDKNPVYSDYCFNEIQITFNNECVKVTGDMYTATSTKEGSEHEYIAEIFLFKID